MAERSSDPESIEKGSDFEINEIQKENPRKEIAHEEDVTGFLNDPVKMKSFLSCKMCRQNFDSDKLRPLLLPCLSAICMRCVQELWASNKTNFECTSCHRVHICKGKGNIILPNDSTREVVLEIIRLTNRESNLICEMCRKGQKATNRCFDCSYFICLDCTKLHSHLRPLENHSIIAIENLLVGQMENLSVFSCAIYCQIKGHEKELLKMFCSTETCMQAICIVCAISTHKDHIINDLAKVVNEKKSKIQKAKESVQLREKQSYASLNQLKQMEERNSEESIKLQEEIIVYFNEEKKVLDQRAMELCNAVKARQSEKESMFNMEKKRLNKFVDSCLETCYYVNIAKCVNNQESFINVSNSLGMRLEELESQAIGNQISFSTDIVKFIPKELDISFKETAKGWGKLMVTKACSSKSKVIITPERCNVGQEIRFQITLVSLEGNMIDDEEVKVFLKHKGKSLTVTQCSFEKSSQTYNGNWISHGPTEITWNVVSNDIELETLKGDLQIRSYSSEGQKRLNEVDQHSTEKGNCCSEMMQYMINIPMNERDYKACIYFASQHSWFPKAYNIQYTYGTLTCVMPVYEGKLTGKKIEEELKHVKMMNCDIVAIENKEINIQQIIEEMKQKKPNVFLLCREESIEIISDSYTELLQVKGLLMQKLSGKVKRGAVRRFKQTDSTKTAADSNVYRKKLNIDDSFHMTSKSENVNGTKVEMKTPEGLEIKIYKESIFHVSVDCIVNEANENLWHGGGVAAAISEAAGNIFDEESKDYIAKYGPIAVGSCAVTSGGKLPYKYVIHTVGPRLGDYFDKDHCLDDLRKSIEVTFIQADKLRMKSIVLPAISSGIFGVPRGKCVQQYYEAVMTFSRSYPFQSLKEIHFVDRDLSMVSAIQTEFQQRSVSSSRFNTTVYPEALNSGETLSIGDKKMSLIHESQFNKQSSTADSIIKISDMLTIKVHLGNITDVTADIVVCPQDEYCSSKGQVARGIFRMLPSLSKPLCSGRKKIGQSLPQKIYGNSPWRMIIHAVSPRWNSKSVKDPEKFQRTLNIMIQEILKTAEDSKYSSIVVPLLGAGERDYLTPMETCARNLYKAVKATQSSLTHLKEIYLVLKEEAAEKAYLDTFEEGGFQVIPKT